MKVPIYIKNTTETTGVWAGRTIEASSYFLVADADRLRFMNDDQTIEDVGVGTLVVATDNDGTQDIASVALATQILISGLQTTQELDPFPLNDGNYSFRGLGVSGSLNSSLVNGGVTDTDTLISEVRYITGAEVWINNSSLYGISIDFQVIDKDNVMGFGANTIIGQFGYGWQVDPKAKNVAFPSYTAMIPAGTYIRCKFTNPNLSSCSFYGNFYLHKKAS